MTTDISEKTILLKTEKKRVEEKTINNIGAKIVTSKLNKQIKEFLLELSAEYQGFSFILSNRFKYKPKKSIYIDENCSLTMPYFALLTLHELGHALCKHGDYNTSVERLRIESEAWECAREVILTHQNWKKQYRITYDEEFVEKMLDSYRDWLHQKTLCKDCGLTRYQTKDGNYHCPNCRN